MATYPGGTAQFVTHQNYVEQVLADHMNAVQNEVVAIESTLGPNPHTLSVPRAPTSASSPATPSTVDGRLDRVEGGFDIPALELERPTTNEQTLSSGPHVAIAWSQINVDTHRIFSSGSSSVTVNQTGFWLLTGYMNFGSTGGGTTRAAYFTRNGVEVTADNPPPPPGGASSRQARASASLGLYLQAGDIVQWFGTQDSGADITVNALMSMVLIRRLA